MIKAATYQTIADIYDYIGYLVLGHGCSSELEAAIAILESDEFDVETDLLNAFYTAYAVCGNNLTYESTKAVDALNNHVTRYAKDRDGNRITLNEWLVPSNGRWQDTDVPILVGPYFAQMSEQAGYIVIAIEPYGDGISGMEVSRVNQNSRDIEIYTSGAYYKVTTTGVEMWRRVHVPLNTYTEGEERLEAEINATLISPELSTTTVTKQETVVETDNATLTFYADSLISVKNKMSAEPFEYTYTVYTDDPEWDFYTKAESVGLNGAIGARIITDGRGGSLHTPIAGKSSVVIGETTNEVTLNAEDGEFCHMVFPPKLYDLEAIYGANAAPMTNLLRTEAEFTRVINYEEYRTEYQTLYHLGNLVIWSHAYAGAGSGNPWGETAGPTPTILTRGPYAGYIGYEFKDSSADNYFKDLITQAHDAGYKVLFYFQGPNAGWTSQSMDTTLAWMEWFQEEFDGDGWYFDGVDYGGSTGEEYWPYQWQVAYEFVKSVRRSVGDGLIMHNNSVDPIGRYSGVRAIMIDAHVDQTVTGDNLVINDLGSDWLYYYGNNYGLSQARSAYSRDAGWGPDLELGSSIAWGEYYLWAGRMCDTPFLDGVVPYETLMSTYFEANYLIYYEQSKYLYLGGGWESPTIKKSGLSTIWKQTSSVASPNWTNVTVTWTTGQSSDSLLAIATIDRVNPADNFVFFDGPTISDVHYSETYTRESFSKTSTTVHSRTLSSLTDDTQYFYIIRSITPTGVIYWDYGTFTTWPY